MKNASELAFEVRLSHARLGRPLAISRDAHSRGAKHRRSFFFIGPRVVKIDTPASHSRQHDGMVCVAWRGISDTQINDFPWSSVTATCDKRRAKRRNHTCI